MTRRHSGGDKALRALLAGLAIALFAGSSQAGTVTYTYDSLGRATSAAYPNGSCMAYLYDRAGNRTQALSQAAGAVVANPVTVSGYQDVPATFDPRLSDPSCLALTVTAVGNPTAPVHGSASVVTGGAGITYTPNAGYLGPDQFSYTIMAGANSATATVSINVQSPTLAPVANNGSIFYKATIPPPPSVTPNGSVNISPLITDPYGYQLTLVSFTQGRAGSVTSGGTTLYYTYSTSVNYNLDDVDSFTYTISDGHGHTATGVIAVKIHVFTRQ